MVKVKDRMRWGFAPRGFNSLCISNAKIHQIVHVNTTNNKIERDPPRSNNLLNTSTPNTTMVLDVNTMLRAGKQYRSGLRLHTFQ